MKANSNLSAFKKVQEFRILLSYVKRTASINIIAKSLIVWNTTHPKIRMPVKKGARYPFNGILQTNEQRPRYGLLHVY